MSRTTPRRSPSSSRRCASSPPRCEAAGLACRLHALDDPGERRLHPRRAAAPGRGPARPRARDPARRMAADRQAARRSAAEGPVLPDDRFLCLAPRSFADWAKGRKALRMEYFYREMRRRTGLLMEGDDARGRQVELRPRQPQARARRPAARGPAPSRPTLRPTRRCWRWSTVSRQLRRSAPLLVRHRPRRREARCCAFHPPPAADFGTYQDAMLAATRSSPRGDRPLPEPRPADPGRGLPTRRRGRVRRRRADQLGRGLHPADPRLARIRARHLRPAGAGLCRQQRAGADRALPGFYWDGATDMACVARRGRTRPGSTPMPTTSSG
jgi:deoxyribodipyrimidine photolyase-related protein